MLKDYNIYTIPVGDYFGMDTERCIMVYAPLKNKFFLAMPAQVDDLEAQLATGKPGELLTDLMKVDPWESPEVSVESFCTLHLLLNEKCNFHCKYCYSAEGRSSAELTMDQIEPMLDFFLSGDRRAVKNRTVMFMGGGEPMLSWPLVKTATLYAEQVAKEQGITLHLSLTTNGSIMDEQMLAFLKEHQFTVQISFEVLPDVQRKQRGNYDRVAENIERLTSLGINNYVRSTITENNVDRIPEMVDYCHENFPLVKKLSCQQVVDPAYFTTTEIVDDFFLRYFKSYQEGMKRAEQYGIALRSSSSHLLNYSKRERFCFNLVCLTPYGTLTLCPDVSSPSEADYRTSVIGELKADGIAFNQDAFSRLTLGSIHTIDKCRQCYARWNCGSGCPSSRRVYQPEIFDAICNYYRKILVHSLMEELARKHKAATGNDFYEDIATKLKNTSA